MSQQETGSVADVKPFSIRQYVLASRRSCILHNWPFSEKYLQMCLNHGVRDVLPPFESLKGCNSNLMPSPNDIDSIGEFGKTEVQHHLIQPQQNVKHDSDLFSHGEGNKVTNDCSRRDYLSSHEEGNQPEKFNLSQSAAARCSIHVHKSRPSFSSSKAVKGKCRRRGRGRCKKRSMVDILAESRHCTLEEIYRGNKLCYTEKVVEGYQQMVRFENISRSELTGGNEDHEVANNIDHMTGRGPLLLKFKLNRCNVNQNNIN
ncbi:uncharacterized protein LOC130737495 [Lotus japonicus]|uniref:uncharacterized protein LOC130737495 n=1 Tax=Lotus japonicus TaxID=34305 RepID=UPI0025901788|nr:uncharacterized protein LOC130737495 [Lotus japonicus]XP_057445264.1 uncharacterized protein LOC130737495 [Lotus japonicus]